MAGWAGKTALFGALMAISACGGGNDVILSGERLDLREGSALTQQAFENKSVKISLGKQITRDSWRTVGASRLHASGHNAFTSGTPSLVWNADIGEGNSRRYRIGAAPVSAAGLVIALDAQSRLTAVQAASGTAVWSVDLTPAGEKPGDANGGSLAIDGDVVYATIGFGDLVALDLKTGAELWRQDLGAVGTAGITVHAGLIYVVAGDGQAWALRTNDGRIKWTLSGPETTTSRQGAAAPAVTDKFAIFPFASGDIYGVFRKGGVRLWSASLAGQRDGVVYANISDISADPVVVGSTVYIGNQSGRFAAYDVETGTRKWTAEVGGYSPAVVLGGSVFVMSDDNSLARLSASNGELIWKQALPYFTTDKERRRKAVFAHYGPVAAGGKLWVASSDGVLRGFDPANGAQIDRLTLPDAAAADPIVVGGVMYVLLADGSLAALQ